MPFLTGTKLSPLLRTDFSASVSGMSGGILTTSLLGRSSAAEGLLSQLPARLLVSVGLLSRSSWRFASLKEAIFLSLTVLSRI